MSDKISLIPMKKIASCGKHILVWLYLLLYLLAGVHAAEQKDAAEIQTLQAIPGYDCRDIVPEIRRSL